jgi:hypothetical protein
MKKYVFFALFLFAAAAAGAETVYLKSGVKVAGKITEKTDNSVVVDIGGASVTYYKDEIDRIDDGSTPAEPEPAPVAAAAPAPAVSAEAVAVVSGAPLSPAKRDLILQFIDVFGTRSSMKANFDQMMSSMSPEEGAKLRSAFSVDAIIEELVPLYDKYFSENDLRAYIAFYGSTDGKKLVNTIPQIMRGSVEVSAKYFEAHMPAEFKKAASDAGSASASADKK